MGEGEITITYETLYELLRKEKTREDIQELDHDFIDSVKAYLTQKRSMLLNPGSQQMLFSEEEQQKTLKQISNIIKVIRELYDRREKKIISLAVNMSKTNSSAIDTSRLLGKEKEMFHMLVDVLNLYRANILCNIIDENRAKDMLSRVKSDLPAPRITPETPATGTKKPAVEKTGPQPTAPEPDNTEISGTRKPDDQSAPSAKPSAATASADSINVRFLTAVPKFIDPKLKVHGPFEMDDTAQLPVTVAEVLIKKGKAEAV
jgi:DNA replication initiation complex subunit (GINS family)